MLSHSLSHTLFFTPFIQSFDNTCHSKYCNTDGLCAPPPVCTKGTYLNTLNTSPPQYSCTPCPRGRYGDEDGQTDSNCSGVCAEGYYCPLGSVSQYQFECGGKDVYCKRGSGSPIHSSAGRYTVNTPTDSITSQNNTVNGFINENYAVNTGNTFLNEGSSDIFTVNGLEESTRTNDAICPVGYYCTGGVRRACPIGRYLH